MLSISEQRSRKTNINTFIIVICFGWPSIPQGFFSSCYYLYNNVLGRSFVCLIRYFGKYIFEIRSIQIYCYEYRQLITIGSVIHMEYKFISFHPLPLPPSPPFRHLCEHILRYPWIDFVPVFTFWQIFMLDSFAYPC